jgi:hypothetical protein
MEAADAEMLGEVKEVRWRCEVDVEPLPPAHARM